jgi:seryl-tRNA synthetase
MNKKISSLGTEMNRAVKENEHLSSSCITQINDLKNNLNNNDIDIKEYKIKNDDLIEKIKNVTLEYE